MCGIAGIFGKKTSDFHVIKNLLSDQSHRGPDCSKIIRVNKDLILGHNRLKIIDLSDKSNQPFKYKNVTLAFNGMIYNYVELREKFLKNFFKFRTNSDTEVILAAYLKWGESCFKKLTGMFSIVLWDENKKRLFCVRDRLGIKPLYYTFKNDNLVFSSEITPIQNIINSKINEAVASNYLNYSLYENRSHTFFERIKQFEPGYIYKFDVKNNFVKNSYWSLYDIIKSKENKTIKKKQTEVKEKIKERINTIKNYYIRSDVKTASLLSSGLDSFFLTDLFSKNDKNLKLLLTFGFKSRSVDESKLIIKTELMKAIEHKIIKSSAGQFLKDLNKVQKEQEGPWGGVLTHSYDELLKYAKKKNVKVIYSGDGADEIFGGYKKYLSPIITKKNLVTLDYFSTHIDGTQTNSVDLLKDEYSKNRINEFYYIKVPSKNNVNNHKFLDIIYNKLQRNFRFSDRFSMRNSIELRYPFLDHKLLELSFDLNKKNHLDNKTNKIVLRKLLKNFKNKKKQHINSPQTEWLYNPSFRKYIYTLLKDSPIFEKFYDHKKTLNFVENFYRSKPTNSFKIWQIINFDLFLRNFFYK